jgi:hypothetical protein
MYAPKLICRSGSWTAAPIQMFSVLACQRAKPSDYWKPYADHHQTTVAPFDDSFVEFLPVVEKATIDHGLDPRDFIIAKDRTQFNSLPGFKNK